MIKDQGPKQNIGFGLEPISGGLGPESVETGMDPNSGPVERFFEGRPVLKFAGVAVASMVSLQLSGKVARAGGYRVAERLSKAAQGSSPLAHKLEQGFGKYKKLQEALDDLEGVTRVRDPRLAQNEWIKRDPKTGDWITDNSFRSDSRAIRESNDEVWALRDEIQQRLVRQARRLPYEIPGFYALDKAVIDPIMGNDEDRNVNWANPFDVVGDFAWETTKNITFGALPVESFGIGGANHAVKRLAKARYAPGGGQEHNMGVMTAAAVLDQVGADFSELSNRIIKKSHQTFGAFAHAVDTRVAEKPSIFEIMRRSKQETRIGSEGPSNANFAKRQHGTFSRMVKDPTHREEIIDAMPGPFKGFYSSAKVFKRKHKEIGETYDNWQAVLNGERTVSSFGGAERERLVEFIRKGGKTHLEDVVDNMRVMGLRTPRSAADIASGKNFDGEFFDTLRQDAYKGYLIDALADKTGLGKEKAAEFVINAARTQRASRNMADANLGLMGRFSFSQNRNYSGFNPVDVAEATAAKKAWWKGIQSDAQKNGVPVAGKVQLSEFEQAVKLADQRLNSTASKIALNIDMAAQAKHVVDNLVPNHLGSTMGFKKPDFYGIKRNLVANENFLVKNTARQLGLRMEDASGNLLTNNQLKEAISRQGLDASKRENLLGFLVDKKVVKGPWSRSGGTNMFGFRQMLANEALSNGYFGHMSPEDQGFLGELLSKASGTSLGRGGIDAPGGIGSLKMPGLYVSASGRVMDVGRLKRSVFSALDTFSDEYRIPVLNFNPLQLGFYQTFRARRSSPAIQVQSRYSAQNVADRFGKNDGAYIFLRDQGRGVGDLFSFDEVKVGSDVSSRQYMGKYAPLSTNAESMAGRYSSTYFGGQPTESPSSGWRKLFSVSSDQPGNMVGGRNSLLGRTLRAVKGDKGKLRNPRVAASRAAQLSGDDIGESLEPELAEGVDNLINQMRRTVGFSEDIINKLRRSGTLGDIGIQQGTPGGVRAQLDEHFNSSSLSREQVTTLRQAQAPLRNLLKRADKESGFWDLPVPREMRTSGVSTRLDQLKAEYSEYLILHSDNVMGASDASSFGKRVAGILNDIESFHQRGLISGKQKAEARAAALSLQFQFSKIKTYQGQTTLNRANTLALKDTLSQEYSKQLLSEYGSYSEMGFIEKHLRRRSGIVPYEEPAKFSSFRGGEYTYAPTLGTSFKDSPGNTLKGLFGASYKNPQSFTPGSFFATHMVRRLNNFFESAGLGLNPEDFKGPLDLFARGMVGKRILPAYAAGTTAMAIDRTAGGMVYEDDQGNPVYRPLVMGQVAKGVANLQALSAGAIPGGQTYEQKKREIFEGEVPVREGRYWLLNTNTPFKGGRVQYFRPSWYQRMEAAGDYAPEMNQTPMKRLMFGYDFSPLRPFAPYKMEEDAMANRPYPVSGQYFTGPFGPVTTALNATVGKVLKPTKYYNEEQAATYMASFQPIGDAGQYSINRVTQNLTGINAAYSAAAGSPGSSSADAFYPSIGAAPSFGPASQASVRAMNSLAASYSSAATSPAMPGSFYAGAIMPNVAATHNSTLAQQARATAFRAQETAGIYGYAFGVARSGLGISNQDYTANNPVLERASRGYSAGRSFWGLNLGGAGDLPLPVEGRYSNIEISEIIRRFVPKDQQGMRFINGIPNELGRQYPWLPGPDSFNNYSTGDPYQALDASIRLPGTARDRVVERFSDRPGQQYGMVDVHAMLGNLDPFGDRYRAVDRGIDSMGLSDRARARVAQTREQVRAMGQRNEFTPYKYKYDSVADQSGASDESPYMAQFNRGIEWALHRDNIINNKFFRTRTALEDWERDNVYSATYANWSSPVESYLEPVVHRATQRNPFHAASAAGMAGYFFGGSARAKAAGSIAGATVGAAASVYGSAYEAITGKRYIPMQRRRELALEEQVDILQYMHSMVNASRSLQTGDRAAASYFLNESTKTMYGANLNATPEQLAAAVPKRKREHFRAMMYAPVEEREQILSTAGRLERRLLQAAYGMQVEKLPDVSEYFENRELPSINSSFWSPFTDMDQVKIKMGQSIGLDMSQMGYYPQQIQEANLINPVYPEVFRSTPGGSVIQQLNRLFANEGIRADIQARPSIFAGNRYELGAGG